MKTSKKFVTIITCCLFSVILMLSTLCMTASAESKNKECSLPEIGVTLSVPSEWPVATRHTGYETVGLSSQEGCQAVFEGLGIYFVSIENSTKAVSIEVSADKINGDVFKAMSESEKLAAYEKSFNSKNEKEWNAKSLSSGMVNINGIDYYFCKTESSSGFTGAIAYMTVKDNNIFTFYYDVGAKFDFSMENVMNSVSFSAPVAATEETLATEKSNDGKKPFELPLWSFVVLLGVLLLIGVKPAKKHELHKDALSLGVAKGIQGFCAVGIVLHHLVQKLNGSSNITGLSFMENTGVIFVGIFFFFSGYGLLASYRNKPDYMKGFLKKRLPTILVPFYVCGILFLLADMAFGHRYSKSEFFSYLTGRILLNTHMWYIIEILVLYVAFFILFRLIKKENIAYALMGIFTVGLVIVSLFLGHDHNTVTGGAWFKGEWWYNSTIMFFVGMSAAKYMDKIIDAMKKFWWLFLTISAGGAVFFWIQTTKRINMGGYWTETALNPHFGDKFKTLAFQFPMILFCVTAFLILSLKLQFKNKIISFLGSIALELYLIHNVFLTNLKCKDNALFIIAVLSLSIMLAYVINKFDSHIINFFTGAYKNNKIKRISSNKEHNHFIDVMRLFMCFLVVCIHIPFEGTLGYVIVGIAKVAVPFFIIVSGYMCYRDDSGEFMSRLKKQCKHIFIIAVSAHLLYAAVYYFVQGQTMFKIALSDKSIINLLLWNESPYAAHLWFLGSLFYAIVVMMLLTKLKIGKYIMYCFPILIGVYFFLWRNDGTVANLSMYRNAVLCTLPYFMAGCLIKKHEVAILSKLKPKVLVLISTILLGAVIFEYFICKSLTIPYYSSELLVYALVLMCVSLPKVGEKTPFKWLGSKCTLFVYIVHIALIWLILDNGGMKYGIIKYLGPVVIFVITLAIAAAYKGLIIFIKSKKEKALEQTED